MQRTLAAQTPKMIGKKVKLQGWTDTIRNHGKIAFIELRDRSGKVQIVGDQKLGKLHHEYVVEIEGVVNKRPKEMINPEHQTGEIEVSIESLKILNKSEEMPFPINTDGLNINEEMRLKYRYLDLRRSRMQKTLCLRSKFIDSLRQQLFTKDFVEIETPMLTRSTKEGARDFVVPSRFQPGKFYALPQSPQQYKQLLMTAGFERYFQVAKCIRDEDLRADRGFEFTQFDLEMSFAEKEDVMQAVEKMVIGAVKAVDGKLQNEKFPVITYQEAMQKYGADKFDLRTQKEKQDGVLAFAWVVDFPFFKQVDKDDVAEIRDGKSGWTFTHNPFSMPNKEHLDWHMQGINLEKILTPQYDLVCNGYEVGGGSIRAHQPEVLKQTFKIMGYSDQEIEESIGHMLKAFRLGTPPHGGIALGIDRLVMLLSQQSSLKESIAFPMNSSGKTSVMEAPAEISEEQFKELGIQVRGLGQNQGQKSILQQILSFLDQEKVKYQHSQHKPVKTSEEAAAVRNVSLDSGAKALVLKTDQEPIMVVLSASSKFDTKNFKKLYGFKKISFADPDLLLKLTGLTPGAVPPFGSLFKLKTFVDEKLLEQNLINFNAGTHSDSVEMTSKDFAELEKPEVGKFSK